MSDGLTCSCVTCRDEAVAMRVVGLDEARGLALCQGADGADLAVELELVDATVGDRVLVHAGVAIARLGEESPA